MDKCEEKSWFKQAKHWSAYLASLFCNPCSREECINLLDSKYNGTLYDYIDNSILETYTQTTADREGAIRKYNTPSTHTESYENWASQKNLNSIYLNFTEESSNSAFKLLLNQTLRTEEGLNFLNSLPERFIKIVDVMSKCQTEAMGFSLSVCEDCGKIQFAGYGSCNNSHCCTCSANKRKQKSIELIQKMFNYPYFLITFTLPHEFNEILDNQNEPMYKDLLNYYMSSIQDTIKTITLKYAEKNRPPLGIPDIMQFLHTWDQKLEKHIHSHVLVSTIGINPETREIMELKPNSKGKYFLAPSDMIAEEYKKRIIYGFESICKKYSKEEEFNKIKERVKDIKFNINCQPPEDQEQNAVLYLAAYSNKVGLSPKRIKKVSNGIVYLCRKRVPDGCDPEIYDLNDLNNCFKIEIIEFFRRFFLHILPDNFKRFRRTGLYLYHTRAKGKPSEIAIRAELLPNQKTEQEIQIIFDKQSEKLKKETGKNDENTQPSIYNNFRVQNCSNCNSNNLIIVSFDPAGNMKSGYENLTEEIFQIIGKFGKFTVDILNSLKKNKLLNIDLLSPIRKVKEIENTT